ncbi:hypothetical protein [Frankia tisae]|uniref:hypothetical protein n=1 Tax=Frankia tisae TaxID=2950104 RepID=UPI0021C0C42E|nr:hypothetical protein [Frankia tisae]
MATRRFQVYDGDGELVATFREWEAAHSWAHRRATEAGTRIPVQVEDRVERRTWTIEADQCRLTVWRRHVEYGYCGRTEARPVAAGRKHVYVS